MKGFRHANLKIIIIIWRLLVNKQNLYFHSVLLTKTNFVHPGGLTNMLAAFIYLFTSPNYYYFIILSVSH